MEWPFKQKQTLALQESAVEQDPFRVWGGCLESGSFSQPPNLCKPLTVGGQELHATGLCRTQGGLGCCGGWWWRGLFLPMLNATSTLSPSLPAVGLHRPESARETAAAHQLHSGCLEHHRACCTAPWEPTRAPNAHGSDSSGGAPLLMGPFQCITSSPGAQAREGAPRQVSPLFSDWAVLLFQKERWACPLLLRWPPRSTRSGHSPSSHRSAPPHGKSRSAMGGAGLGRGAKAGRALLLLWPHQSQRPTTWGGGSWTHRAVP